MRLPSAVIVWMRVKWLVHHFASLCCCVSCVVPHLSSLTQGLQFPDFLFVLFLHPLPRCSSCSCFLLNPSFVSCVYISLFSVYSAPLHSYLTLPLCAPSLPLLFSSPFPPPPPSTSFLTLPPCGAPSSPCPCDLGHLFHRMCARQWLQRINAGATCPICRRSVLLGPPQPPQEAQPPQAAAQQGPPAVHTHFIARVASRVLFLSFGTVMYGYPLT